MSLALEDALPDVEMHCRTCSERLRRDIYVSTNWCHDHAEHDFDRVLPFGNFWRLVRNEAIGEPHWLIVQICLRRLPEISVV